MKIKCIACDWEWDSAIEEEVRSWETCPNCDFPYKFTSWIEQLQNEIIGLRTDVDKMNRLLGYDHLGD